MATDHSAVIFDMDGLLVESEPLYMRAWQQAASELGFRLTPAFYQGLIGIPETACSSLLVEEFGPNFSVSQFGDRWKQLWLKYVKDGELVPKPGACELLRSLRGAQVPVAVATSSARSDAELSLRKTNLGQFFSHIVTAEDVTAGKPSPEIYLLAASRLGVIPEHCLVLEDSPAGAVAGLSAGMSVIIVPDLVQPDSELSARSLLVAHDLREATPQVLRVVHAA